LLAIWVLGIPPYPYPCIGIRGELGAAEKEGVSGRALSHNKLGKEPSFYNEVQTCLLELVFKAKDLVKDTRALRVSWLKGKCQNLYFGSFDIGREAIRRAVNFDSNLLARDNRFRMLKSIKDPLADIFNDSLELDGLTLITEIGASLITSMSGEKGTVSSKNLERQQAQQLSDLHKHMEDLIVEGLAQPSPEISEGSLTWQMRVSNASVEAIMFPFFPVMDRVKEGLHIGGLFKVAEQLDEKQTNRVIGKTTDAISMRHNRADEGKIHQGGYEPRQAPYYTAIGMDLNVSPSVDIF